MAIAQPVLPGYGALDAEIRAGVEPLRLYLGQASVAFDAAIDAGRFARADSIATLAETRVSERTGTDREALAWPTVLDRLALAMLLEDPVVLDVLAGGAWKQPWDLSDGGLESSDIVFHEETWGYRHRWYPVLRPSVDAAVRAHYLERRIGETEEEHAVVHLAARSWTVASPWASSLPHRVSTDREALNADALAFLSRYPESRYRSFVRQSVLVRYEANASAGAVLAGGMASTSGGLGERTEDVFALDVGLDLRARWWHLGLTAHGGSFDVPVAFEVGTERAEAEERYQLLLAGLEGGPLVRVGWAEVMPYVAVGQVNLLPTQSGGSPVHGSTFNPPAHLGLGYGVKLGVRRIAVWESAPGLHARIGWVPSGLGTRAGVDLDGSVRVVTVGLSWFMNGGRRVE